MLSPMDEIPAILIPTPGFEILVCLVLAYGYFILTERYCWLNPGAGE